MLGIPVNPVWGWVALALVAGPIEAYTVSFGFLFLGIAAILCAVLAFFEVPGPVQLTTFGLGMVVSLVWVRASMKRLSKVSRSSSIGEQQVGRLGRVTETMETTQGKGRVLVDGVDWAAASTVTLPEGTPVVVHRVNGITLWVEPTERHRVEGEK